VIGPDNGPPKCTCTHPIDQSNFGVAALGAGGRSLFLLVSGRLPDPSNPREVLASFTLQHDEGVQLGTVIRVPFCGRSQTSAFNNASGAPPPPTGPTIAFRVVGFEATEFEFPSGAAPTYFLYASPAFTREVLPRTAASYLYFVRLRHGANRDEAHRAENRHGGKNHRDEKGGPASPRQNERRHPGGAGPDRARDDE